MVEFGKIKCIIWDLDNSLWKGVLAETPDEISLNGTARVLKLSSAIGMINSICSKNDRDRALQKLADLRVDDYFVFSSINYQAKGLRVREQISQMHLRAENVLFVDDEVGNLNEVRFYNEGIQVSRPFIIAELERFCSRQYDAGVRGRRLDQYRILESKSVARQKVSDNRLFLRGCAIRVEISHDWHQAFDRIYELNQRTSQLNFTKCRMDEDRLRAELVGADQVGVVRVRDRFGDYGVVGYYVMVGSRCVEFVFSCRVLNMGIEQYVYEVLGRPVVEVAPPVASDLVSPVPDWINSGSSPALPLIAGRAKTRALLKGNCDFRRMQMMLPENVEYEVQYVENGKHIVYQTGLPTMAMTALFGLDRIRELAAETPFYDDRYYVTTLFSRNYDVVFLSLISLANLGVYKHKGCDFFLSMGLPSEPMYLPEYEAQYSPGGRFANGFSNSRASFEYLRSNFDYLGDGYYGRYLSSHVKTVLSHIMAPKIVLVLGNEERYRPMARISSAGATFRTANRIVKDAAATDARVSYIDLSDLVTGEDDVINHFNHFSSRVYYDLSNLVREHIC